MRLRRPESLAITFTGPGQVEVRPQQLPRPKRDDVLLDARCSLVSTGTERTCLERDFAPGSHWDSWVRYPFHPGYSFVGVTPEDARMCAHAPHAKRAVVGRQRLIEVPEGVSDEAASWFALASIAQIRIAAAGIEPGDAVVVIGAGVIGQLVAQLARAPGPARRRRRPEPAPRLDVALAHGATSAVAAGAGEAAKAVRSGPAARAPRSSSTSPAASRSWPRR